MPNNALLCLCQTAFMKRCFSLIVLSILTACSPEQKTSQRHSVFTTAKIQKVSGLEDRWMKALQARDTATLSRLLAPAFVLSGQSQNVETRAQYLQTSAMSNRTLEPVVLADRHFEVFDNTVISTGRATYAGTWKENSFHLLVRYTHVYVKSGKDWKVVAAHLSMLD